MEDEVAKSAKKTDPALWEKVKEGSRHEERRAGARDPVRERRMMAARQETDEEIERDL